MKFILVKKNVPSQVRLLDQYSVGLGATGAQHGK